MPISHEEKGAKVRGGKRVASKASTKVWPLVAIYGTQKYDACTQTFVFLLFSGSLISDVCV